jgi:hypothetical protein
MTVLAIQAFYTDGVEVGSCNVELDSEGRLPVAAVRERFGAQHGLVLDRTEGNLLVADSDGYSTRTFCKTEGHLTVFLPPKPVEQADEIHSGLTSIVLWLVRLASSSLIVDAGRDDKKTKLL